MSLDTLLDIGSVQTKWVVGIIGVIVFLFLIARRRSFAKNRSRNSRRETHDLVVEWESSAGGQIPVQPWMETGNMKALLAALSAGGKEVRFVGGCVRDALLHRDVGDIDLATQERPDRVIELLENAGIQAIPTGIEHGTVTAAFGSETYQITTLRKDVKTDGRHAEVAFTEDWKEDAFRRDFTFNTLSATPDGMVYDYCNGIQDLAERRIHFVGQAEKRIKEDYLRILRFFRFIATLGMRIDDKFSYQQCIRHAPELATLSGERIRVELFKIFASEIKYDALKLMKDGGITQHFLPELAHLDKLKRLIWLETMAIKFDHVAPDPVRRLAAAIETDADGVREITQRLKLSNAERDHLLALVEPAWTPDPDTGEDTVRGALYRLGPSVVIDLGLLEWARRLTTMPRLPREQTDAWLNLMELADQWEPVEFPVRGQDVLDMNIEPGKYVSELLAQVEDWWIAGGCRAGRDDCLAELRRVANA
jgi:poly(A) polymerase